MRHFYVIWNLKCLTRKTNYKMSKRSNLPGNPSPHVLSQYNNLKCAIVCSKYYWWLWMSKELFGTLNDEEKEFVTSKQFLLWHQSSNCNFLLSHPAIKYYLTNGFLDYQCYSILCGNIALRYFRTNLQKTHNHLFKMHTFKYY